MALAGIFWLCYLRLLLPLRNRLDLGIEVISSCADVFCFVGALVLNIVKTDNVKYTCGSYMAALRCADHLLTMLTRTDAASLEEIDTMHSWLLHPDHFYDWHAPCQTARPPPTSAWPSKVS